MDNIRHIIETYRVVWDERFKAHCESGNFREMMNSNLYCSKDIIVPGLIICIQNRHYEAFVNFVCFTGITCEQLRIVYKSFSLDDTREICKLLGKNTGSIPSDKFEDKSNLSMDNRYTSDPGLRDIFNEDGLERMLIMSQLLPTRGLIDHAKIMKEFLPDECIPGLIRELVKKDNLGFLAGLIGVKKSIELMRHLSDNEMIKLATSYGDVGLFTEVINTRNIKVHSSIEI